MKYKCYHSCIKICHALGVEKQLISPEFLKGISPSTSHYWKNDSPERYLGGEFASVVDDNLGDVPLVARVLGHGTQLAVIDPYDALLDLPVDVSVEIVSLGCNVADDKHLAFLLDNLDVVMVETELVGQDKVSTLDACLAIKDMLTPIIVHVEAPKCL